MPRETLDLPSPEQMRSNINLSCDFIGFNSLCVLGITCVLFDSIA